MTVHSGEPIEIVREVPLSQQEAFSRLTDWQRHGDVVPLTSVRLTDTGFVARTGLGPVGFDDPMEVVESGSAAVLPAREARPR